MTGPFLVGDVGGTNARFALIDGVHSAARDIVVLPSADFPDLGAAAEEYLSRVGQRPTAACVAVAGPVVGDHIDLTNVAWRFSVEKTRRQLGLDRLLVVNDFLALAMAVPQLPGSGMLVLGKPEPTRARFAGGTIAVVGPGTGLGVAAVIPAVPAGGQGTIWTALATEGGHVGLAPESELEAEILARLRSGSERHVSAEAVLSGPGLEQLHRTLRQIEGSGPPQSASAAQIIEGAQGGKDAACVRSVEVFAGLLGSFAGNVALTLGARGGMYIGGGVAQRLAADLQSSAFRQRFEAKGVMSPYLRAIPTS